jgi:hypothetical protein
MSMNVVMHGKTVDGRIVPMIVDDQGSGGGVGGGFGAPSASPLANGWSYAAESGGITSTSDVPIKAAAGAGRYNYLSSIDVMNTDASVATEVVIKDGSTVIWRTKLAALAANTAPVPFQRHFNPPLVGSNNAALNVACVTNSAEVYINAQGYVGGAPNQVALNTNTDVEIYDRFANLMTDRDGNTLTLRS